MSKDEVIRKPNPGPQTKVLTCIEGEILYGGARGGGKTDAGIARLTRWIDNSLLRALVLRETYDDLSDWIDRAMNLYESFGAKKTGIPVTIEFPSGAKIRTGYLKGQSYDKYKGHEYQKLIIEELTQIPSEENYEKLLGSRRSTVDGLKPQIFMTTNPDGIGRSWVKRRFVDIQEAGERYTDDKGNTRIYIPAKLEDNPVLVEKDPGYMNYLDGIKDDQLRKAWRDGDREAYDIKGGIYNEQIKQIRAENRITTVLHEPGVLVHTARDIGIDDTTTVLYFQIIGKEIRVINTYSNRAEGVSHYVREMKELQDLGYNYGFHMLPHDAKAKSKNDGKTYEEYMKQSMKDMGVGGDIKIIKRTTDIWLDIAEVRKKLAYMRFNRDTTQTLLDHIEVYRQVFDERTGRFSDKPYHGIESHFADGLRYTVMGYIEHINRPIRESKVYTYNYRNQL